jgi:hypothetical protein
MTEIPSLKDEELDVIGELISNMYGAVEVHKMVKNGTDKRSFTFMKRVLGSIDKSFTALHYAKTEMDAFFHLAYYQKALNENCLFHI